MDAASSQIFDWSELIRLGTVAAVVWSAAWFLFRQASQIQGLVYVKFTELKNNIVDKLEYHERHDDGRFDQVSQDLSELRVGLARLEGQPRTKNQR